MTTAPPTINIRPLHDRVVARRHGEKTQTAGGLFIPDNAKEKPLEAVVIAVGAGKRQDDGTRRPMGVAVGDHVLIGKYAGAEVTLAGDDLIILGEDDLLAVLSPEAS